MHHRPVVLALLLCSACDSTSPSADSKTAPESKTQGADAKADAEPGKAKGADAKAGDAKATDAKATDAKAGDAKAGDAKAGDAKSDVETGYEAGVLIGKQAAARPRAPTPATAKDAAQQLSDWLNDPEKAAVPPLLDAAGAIEIAAHCGPCTDNPKPELSKTTGKLMVVERIAPPPEDGEGVVEWQVDDVEACKVDCCTFPKYPSDSEGSGATNIDKICMKLDGDKPTAYTRIDIVNH